jgi:hypothetical protein
MIESPWCAVDQGTTGMSGGRASECAGDQTLSLQGAAMSSPNRSAQAQRWCALAGAPFVLLLFAGLLISGFLPPVVPHQSAETLKELFVADRRGVLRVRPAAGLHRGADPA